MKLTSSVVDKILIIKIEEEYLDIKNAVEFKNQVNELINKKTEKILFNFSKINFIDSTGLGSIVTIIKILGSKGSIAICNISDTVKEIFWMTRMDKVFLLYNNEEEALEALTGNK